MILVWNPFHCLSLLTQAFSLTPLLSSAFPL